MMLLCMLKLTAPSSRSRVGACPVLGVEVFGIDRQWPMVPGCGCCGVKGRGVVLFFVSGADV